MGRLRQLLSCTGCTASDCASDPEDLDRTEDLPEQGPLGAREEALRALAICARLVYGMGFINKEAWGFFDPPLNGEGWKVVQQVCETRRSKQQIQAACYMRAGGPYDVAIVSYRGTVSREGLLQDISLKLPRKKRIKRAVKEASSFCLKCAARYPSTQLYITGHSLGGYIAEAVATFCDVPGAVFNCPGPWARSRRANLTGEYRPSFEIHLTRSDPLAAVFFPKPENNRHIGTPHWHEGNNHRVCQPYMVEVSQMVGVCPNDLPFNPDLMVDQMADIEEIFPPPSEIGDSDDGSEANDSEDE